jgi:uncharacterized repeat protein (TIGR01451 family)
MKKSLYLTLVLMLMCSQLVMAVPVTASVQTAAEPDTGPASTSALGPVLEVTSVTPVDFGDVPVSTNSTPQSVYDQERRDATAVITSIGLSTDLFTPLDFGTTEPFLQPGQSVTGTGMFSPVDEGLVEETLCICYSDNTGYGNYSVCIPLRGNGVDPAKADLEITKTGSTDSVFVNDNFLYTITVINNGYGDATGVVVSDTLPGQVEFVSSNPSLTPSGQDITWNIGALAKDATATWR